jgi:gamma-glutamyltranspeptidase/glutathione hydrolase
MGTIAIHPPVRSRKGIVTCPHYLASAVGVSVLRQGGTAVDAAISVQAALCVVYPHMTGLGGDAFWLIYCAQSHNLTGLNGSGRAAAAATPEVYRSHGGQPIPQRGLQAAITVPGAVDSWHEAHQRFGRLDWAELLLPACKLAAEGYPVTGSQVYWTRRDRPYFEQHSPSGCPFLPNGRVPEVKTQLTNPDLAAVLRILAMEGATAFYNGTIARRLTNYFAAHHGLLTEEDFAQHHSTWVDPIFTSYRGHRVAQLPPNSQGFTLLQMLNWIEPYDVRSLGDATADYLHLMVEATKLAFSDRDYWLTDPDFVDIPLATLIAKSYCDPAAINWRKAAAVSSQPLNGDTTYTAIVDAEGNAVSVIQSLYFDFGSAVIVPDTGFALHNRGCFFSLNPAQVNYLAPQKRTAHTLMPAMVLDVEARPAIVLGTMGGEGQPQTQLALLTRLLDFGYDAQAAIDAPRWLWGKTWGETCPSLMLEGRIPVPIRQALSDLGHPIQAAPAWTEKMGHANVIRYCPETQEFEGGCDPRSDGQAIAL